MEVIDKDVLHVDEFFREFLITRICTKNAFACGAGRLHFVRQFLQTQKISYNLALSVMERHQQISDDDRSIKSGQLTSLLHDIFYAADKLDLIADPLNWQKEPATVTSDPDRQASRLTCFLASVFDPTNSRNITLLELKTALLMLCATNSVEELVQHHLNLLIDHNRCIHQTRFKIATGAILKVFHRLDKEEAVVSDVDTLVANSFAKVTGLAGLSDTQFYQFWNTENRKNPSEISYYFSVLLFSRCLDSDVVHPGIMCTGCQSKAAEKNAKENNKIEATAIRGVRFRCSRCSSINLCSRCFLGDFQTPRHNPATHKFTVIQEPVDQDDGGVRRGKRGNLLAKLLKVFYFARSRRGNNLNVEADGNQSVDGDEVKTIRFLDETLRSNDGPAMKKDNNGKDKLLTVIEMLSLENRLFQENLAQIQQTCSPDSEFHKYLEQHKNILTAQIAHLQEIWKSSGDSVAMSAALSTATPPTVQAQKFHSTPFRRDLHLRTINWDLTGGLDASSVTAGDGSNVGGEVSKQIRGDEIERTYYEANRSDRSLQEISTWLHLRDSFCRELISLPGNTTITGQQDKNTLDQSGMQSFRELLHKVRDILEDTYSDNAQLSTVTRQLESALDDIIGEEERKSMLQKQDGTKGKRAGLKQN